jgi:hypothetical protein
MGDIKEQAKKVKLQEMRTTILFDTSKVRRQSPPDLSISSYNIPKTTH